LQDLSWEDIPLIEELQRGCFILFILTSIAPVILPLRGGSGRETSSAAVSMVDRGSGMESMETLQLEIDY